MGDFGWAASDHTPDPSSLQGCVSPAGWHWGHGKVLEGSSVSSHRGFLKAGFIPLTDGPMGKTSPVHYLVEGGELEFLHDSVHLGDQVQELGVP